MSHSEFVTMLRGVRVAVASCIENLEGEVLDDAQSVQHVYKRQIEEFLANK